MLLYYGPDGQSKKNPDLEFMKGILNKEAVYWSKGSGDSSLQFENSDEMIIFFKDDPYGIFIMQHPDYISPYIPNIDIKTIYHRIGGELMPIPSCCYLSINEAEKILFNYINNKVIIGIEEWKDIYDIIDYEE